MTFAGATSYDVVECKSKGWRKIGGYLITGQYLAQNVGNWVSSLFRKQVEA